MEVQEKETTVAQPRWLVPGFAAAGMIAGFLAKLAAGWVVEWPWVPFEGPLRMLVGTPEPWQSLCAVAVGTVAGLVVGLIGLHESLALRVSGSRVELSVKDATWELGRDRVRAAFLDGKELVVLSTDGTELAREKCDLDADRVSAAFTRHGYTWLDTDPFHSDFRRWVPGATGLPPGADAVLRARAQLLRKGGEDDDLRELREELAALGIVVRVENKRQWWRAVAGHAPDGTDEGPASDER